MMKAPFLPVFLGLLLGPTSTSANELAAAARTSAAKLAVEDLKPHIATLASDAFEGRGPSSAGDLKTRQYIIEQLKRLGIAPGNGKGGYEQAFEIFSLTSSAPAEWLFVKNDQRIGLAQRDDFIATSGVQTEKSTIKDAELVFVGYGIEAPEYGWDDFKGVDVAGKVLLMLNNDPDWDPALFEGTRRLYYGRWTYKYEQAAAKGAVAAIILHTQPSAGYNWTVVQNSWGGAQFQLPAAGEKRLQVSAWTTEAATRRLLGAAGHNLDALIAAAKRQDFKPVNLGLKTSLELKNQIERKSTANVLGLLSGSDARLAQEFVVLGAHHDHLGVGQPDQDGDGIFNGAVDNATGVAQILALAKSFKALPRAPRRSVLFAFWAAEEQGLLGSRFFSFQPTAEPGALAANINIDGANIWGKTKDVVFIGYGKSDLDALVEAAAARQGRTVKPDQLPDRGFFYRSDQFNLARIGVPAIYLDNGVEFIGREPGWAKEQVESWEATKYHQPNDELEDWWSWEGALDDLRLLFEVAVEVAEKSALPAWKAGDEFEATRLKALAARRR